MTAQARVAPRVLENPVIGDRVTFLKTAAETNGEYLLERLELAPHGAVGPMHYHLTFAETFEVLAGRLNVDLDGRQLVLGPGERLVVPVKAPHRFYSTSDEPVIFTIECRPARRMEQATRIAYGLARDGRTNAKAIPTNIWEMAVVFELGESYLVGLPRVVQQALFGTLARIARWLGVERALEERYL